MPGSNVEPFLPAADTTSGAAADDQLRDNNHLGNFLFPIQNVDQQMGGLLAEYLRLVVDRGETWAAGVGVL